MTLKHLLSLVSFMSSALLQKHEQSKDLLLYWCQGDKLEFTETFRNARLVNINHDVFLFQVARVIIEAASHRVRLRRPNTLTFDSTGPSKPVNAICSTIAQFFEIPYVRCDCSMLGPMTPVKE